MLRRESVRTILGLHPGLILAALDLIGLFIAGYLAVVEVGGGVPVCGPLKGCETVAQSEYSRIAGIPVAVYGVVLSLTLLTLALAWWRVAAGRSMSCTPCASRVSTGFSAPCAAAATTSPGWRSARAGS